MVFCRIGPRGETRNPVDLPEEATDQLVAVLTCTELVNICNQTIQHVFDISNGLVGVILALPVQALPVLDELFAVEAGALSCDMLACQESFRSNWQTVAVRWRHRPRVVLPTTHQV